MTDEEMYPKIMAALPKADPFEIESAGQRSLKKNSAPIKVYEILPTHLRERLTRAADDFEVTDVEFPDKVKFDFPPSLER